MNRPSALLVSGNWAIGLKVLTCLRFAGYDVDVLSLTPASKIRRSFYRRGFDALPTQLDPAERAAAIVDFVLGRAVNCEWRAIVADDLESHACLHEAVPKLPIPAFAPASRSLLNRCHDKWSFYQEMTSIGVEMPRSSVVCEGAGATLEQADSVGWPLLVKPPNTESGHGIVRFNDFDRLRSYLSTPGPYKALPLKLQRFIEGHELGVSFLAEQGRIRTLDVQLDSDDFGARHFYEDAEAAHVARRIVKHFGFGGPGHIDFIRERKTGRLFVLEFNPRYWYSVTASLWRGGNFPAMAVDLAQGRTIHESPTRLGRYFQPKALLGSWRHPRRLALLDRSNVRGFLVSVSDPLPHLW